MFSCSLISLLAFSCASLWSLALSSHNRFTFFEGSYQQYPAWTPTPHRILRLTFQTSERDGVLVYTEGCTADDHLLVRLEGGAVVARLSLGENGERHLQEESLGENLNDNTPHTITIYQDPALYQLRYVLDSLDPVEETYPSDLYPEFGESGVYLGGVPDSSPRSGEAPFNTSYVGCLEDVVFANGTISSEGVATSELSVVGVVGTRGMVQDGCLDPCSGMSCGEGSCVARWPDRGFCDCRNTMALGVACDEDPSTHQLTFEPDSDPTHYCYRPVIEPYASDANSATLQLVPPIPEEGTLLIAHTESGEYLFSLRVAEGRIVYANNKTLLSLATNLDLSNTSYQIDLTTTSNSAELVLSSVEGVVVTEVERDVVTMEMYPEGAIFSTVCVGGSLLEYLNYVGTIRSAFYGFNSLLEERNFCPLEIEGVSRSDLIVFVDNGEARTLTFERFTLNNSIVSFEARLPLGEQGALLLIENSRYLLRFTSITTDVQGRLFPQITEDGKPNNFWFNPLCSPVYEDDEWHSLIITSDFSDEANPSITILIDGSLPCVISSTVVTGFPNTIDVNEALLSFANLPLSFGTTHPTVTTADDELSIFHGCIHDFQFQSTLEPGVVFRPNLEAVPRESSEFDISFCYHCNINIRCETLDQVCMERGFGLEPECDCTEGLTGEACDELIGPNLDDIAPNLNCSASSVTTPTYTSISSLCPTTTPPPPPNTTTPPPSPSPSPSPTSTGPPPVPPPSSNVRLGVGLGVGVAVLLIILLMVIIVVCVLYRKGAGVRGFYKTHESSNQDAPMVRYSASLRQLSSEVISPGSNESNHDHVSWTHKNGDYLNGNVPSINPLPVSNRTESREKEFYL